MLEAGWNTSTIVGSFLRDGRKLPGLSSMASYVDLAEVAPSSYAERLHLILNSWYEVKSGWQQHEFFCDDSGDMA
jgi:hypothetical protein